LAHWYQDIQVGDLERMWQLPPNTGFYNIWLVHPSNGCQNWKNYKVTSVNND
jgi:hypothetical protein